MIPFPSFSNGKSLDFALSRVVKVDFPVALGMTYHEPRYLYSPLIPYSTTWEKAPHQWNLLFLLLDSYI